MSECAYKRISFKELRSETLHSLNLLRRNPKALHPNGSQQ